MYKENRNLKTVNFKDILVDALNDEIVKDNEIIKQSEQAKKELNDLGITPQADYYITNRNFVNIPSSDIQSKTAEINYSFNRQNSLFNKFYYVENLVDGCLVPYVDMDGFLWKEVGFSAPQLNPDFNGYKLEPKRIVAQVKVSKMILAQNKEFQEQFSGILVKCMEDKVLESMLNDSAEGSASGDCRPQGIFYNIGQTDVYTVEDIFTQMRSIDSKNINAEFIVSGGARADLINLTNNCKLLDDNKLFGSNCYIENKMQEDCFAYLDLSKILLASWGYYGITVDKFTESHKGNVIFTVEGYFDYKALDNDCIKFFKCNNHGLAVAVEDIEEIQ